MALESESLPHARRSNTRRPTTASGHDDANLPKSSRDPHVISSLIASLDRESSLAHASYSYSYVSSVNNNHNNNYDKSRSPSFDHNLDHDYDLADRPPLRHSQSFGVEYRPYRCPSRDQDYDTEGAEFPVIRTSRRPSAKSTRTAPPSPQLDAVKDLIRSASKTTLSFASGGQERLSRASSRVSSDSWNKTQPSPRKLSLDAVTDRLSRRLSLSRASHDTLPTSRDPQQSADEALLSPVSTVPKKDPQRLAYSSNGRLYLEDVQEHLDPFTSQPPPINTSPSRNTTPRRSPVKTRTGSLPPTSSTSRIADTVIPLRSSSLNRIPGLAKSKPKKLGKGKRPMSTLREEKAHARSRMDSSKDMFDGLDEEDQTVMRIRELRQRKQDRLRKESEALSKAQSGTRHVHDPLSSTVASNPAQSKLPAIRIPTRSPNLGKAHRMLGLEPSSNHDSTALWTLRQDTTTLSPLTVYQDDPSLTRDFRKQDVSTLDPKIIPSASLFHGDAASYRPFRTSVSYAFGEVAYDSSTIGRLRAVARTSTSSPLLNGLDIEGIDLSPPGTARLESTHPSRSPSVHARRSLDDSKTRRKSMSDAREDRLLEDDVLRDRDDSVSTAVDIFLSKPRLNQRIHQPQTGRAISFSEVGDPNGFAVIVCVGMGLTRFVSVFYDELAASLGLRLITPERPGVGASEPLREKDNIGPLGWTDDVLAITKHLGISQFSLIAHSAGAVYALATALILPQSVRGSVQLLAPWIPPSQFEHLSQKDRSPDSIPVAALTRGQRFLRVLPVPFLRAANGNFFSASSLKPVNARNNGPGSPGTNSPRGAHRRRNSMKRPDPIRRESMMLMDQVIPEKPRDTMFPLPELWEDERTGIERVRKPSLELSATASPLDPAFALAADTLLAAEHSARENQAAYSTLLTERTWTLATRDSNPAVDLIVCLERHRDVGFRYVDVQRKVVITHGSEDKRVPVENIRWIGDQMNRHSVLHMNLGEKVEKEFKSTETGCEIRVLPGEGHGLMAQPGVMSDILSDIAKEWSGTRC